MAQGDGAALDVGDLGRELSERAVPVELAAANSADSKALPQASTWAAKLVQLTDEISGKEARIERR